VRRRRRDIRVCSAHSFNNTNALSKGGGKNRVFVVTLLSPRRLSLLSCLIIRCVESVV